MTSAEVKTDNEQPPAMHAGVQHAVPALPQELKQLRLSEETVVQKTANVHPWLAPGGLAQLGER